MSKRTKTLLLALIVLALLVGLFFVVKLLLPQEDEATSSSEVSTSVKLISMSSEELASVEVSRPEGGYVLKIDRKNNLRRVDFSPFSPSPADDAAKLLKTIGVPAHLTGYHYIKMGLTLLLENPARFSYGTKGLYQAIAQQTHSSYHRVERNIRTAVEAAFDRGDLALFEKFFGSSIDRTRGRLSLPGHRIRRWRPCGQTHQSRRQGQQIRRRGCH